MGVGIRGVAVLSICVALHLSANAAPAQISCDGGLTQTDTGTVDRYLCTGNMTLSGGSLVVADTLNLTAQGNLTLVGVSIQAKSIELSARDSLSIDAGTTLGLLPGSNGGSLHVGAGSYDAILGTYMGATISIPGAVNVGAGVIAGMDGSNSLGGNQAVVQPGDLIIAVPEPSTAAMMLLAMAFLGVAIRRNQR